MPEGNDQNQNNQAQAAKNIYGCEVEEKPLKVNGGSLAGLVEDGAEMKVLMGYYNCNEVKKGDIVLYSYSSERNPLIKIVKGVPGDKFELKKTLAGCWNLLINNEVSKNFQNEPYCLTEQGNRMLSLYIDDYNGVIPENAYLILGNLVVGSMDSSRFGLVGRQDLVGKAVSG